MNASENPFANSPALKDATRELIVERFRARGVEPTAEQVDELVAVLDKIVDETVAAIHSRSTPYNTQGR